MKIFLTILGWIVLFGVLVLAAAFIIPNITSIPVLVILAIILLPFLAGLTNDDQAPIGLPCLFFT